MIEGLKELGKTVFLTTHYMDEAQHLADRVAILRDGMLVAEGSTEELGGSPRPAHRGPLPASDGARRRGARAQRVSGHGWSFRATRRASRPSSPRRDVYRLLGWAEGRASSSARSRSAAPASRTSSSS